MKKAKTDLSKAVKSSEENAMGVLVELFDWLDGLEPQATMGMFPLQEIGRMAANTPAPMGQVVANQERNSVSFHLIYTFYLKLTLVA
jgi:hypothetical protein